MSKPSRLGRSAPGGTYFISTSTFEKRNYLQADRLCLILIETVYDYRSQNRFRLHEFVFMPNHIHLLFTPEDTVERSMQLIKGGFSYRLKEELNRPGVFWQRGFSDRRVRDLAEYVAFSKYIHQNPVKARLVERVEDFPFSSGNGKFELDPAPGHFRG